MTDPMHTVVLGVGVAAVLVGVIFSLVLPKVGEWMERRINAKR